ncbi:MAG: hypothetical protein H7332_14670 [Bdellovibrionales bacterium]|nr:hypothetical protein [Ramlibacter sp.]
MAVVPAASAAPRLDLSGYSDATGAISVLHNGPAVDPYFAMQALLLAHDNGLDTTAASEKFANWLITRQKPDGTFDRFCRMPESAWVSCKVADADDALLAIWMRLLETMPQRLRNDVAWKKSYAISQSSLNHLYQPSRGIYMVSPVYLHGLFMDNLEVWSLKTVTPQPSQEVDARKLAAAIQATFWDPVAKRFLVSTQLEQRGEKPVFYPDHVAQIFPLLVGFPVTGVNERQFYRDWMRSHRSEWLRQGVADYPWGLIAVLALKQGDTASARCWMRESAALRHGVRWAVTDEASHQILASKGITAAVRDEQCK